jgi:hypothetical protein
MFQAIEHQNTNRKGFSSFSFCPFSFFIFIFNFYFYTKKKVKLFFLKIKKKGETDGQKVKHVTIKIFIYNFII